MRQQSFVRSLRVLVMLGFLSVIAVSYGETNNPKLGLNLGGPQYYQPDLPFVDLLKSSYPLIAFPTQRDANNNFILPPYDAQGNPLGDFATYPFILTSPVPNGVYHLSYDGGTASTVVGYTLNDGTVVESAPTKVGNTTFIDFTLNNDTILLLTFSNTGGTVKNIHFLQAGYNFPNYPIYTSRFENYVRRFPVLRFMDFLFTNGNPLVNWSDRNTLETVNWSANTKGVPLEACLALANDTGADVWLNVPYGASDDYISQMAALVRDNLPAGKHAYIEWTNEVWNYQFPQTTQNLNAAKADPTLLFPGETVDTVNLDDLRFRRVGRQVKHISDLFKAAYTSQGLPNPINDKIRVVLLGQVSGNTTTEPALSYINRVYGSPGQYIYGTGGGGVYFQLPSSEDTPGLTSQQILDRLAAASNNDPVEYGYAASVARNAWYNVNHTVNYEGGPDVATTGNNISAKRDALLSSTGVNNIKSLDEQTLNQYFTAGGDLFMWFSGPSTSYDSQFAFWGLTNNIDTNPNSAQSQAMDDILAVAPPTPSAGDAVPGDVPGAHAIGSADPTAADIRFIHPTNNPNYADYLVQVPSDGTYAVTPYLGGYGTTTVSIAANSGPATQTSIAPTSADAYVPAPAVNLQLHAGFNDIRVTFLAEVIASSLQKLAVASGSGGGGGGTGSGTTTSISVPNPSFEADGRADYISPQGWTFASSGTSANNYAVQYVAGSGTATAAAGSYFWAPGDFNPASAPFGTSTATLTTNASLGTYTAASVYNLTVAVADPADNTDVSTKTVTLELLANGVVVAQTTVNGLQAGGGFSDYNLTFNTASNTGVVGQNITVALVYSYSGNYNRSIFFDNVRLTKTN